VSVPVNPGSAPTALGDVTVVVFGVNIAVRSARSCKPHAPAEQCFLKEAEGPGDSPDAIALRRELDEADALVRELGRGLGAAALARAECGHALSG
jgi:hypothetical protein